MRGIKGGGLNKAAPFLLHSLNSPALSQSPHSSSATCNGSNLPIPHSFSATCNGSNLISDLRVYGTVTAGPAFPASK